jgi:class 3 adenylate cyclase/uncharacterized membrane-anchored protein YhcB (DUF1043 family)
VFHLVTRPLVSNEQTRKVRSMQCPQCRTVNPEQKSFCFECGSALSLLCPKCGHAVLSTHKFCGECGFRLRKGRRASRLQLLPSAGERKNVTVLFSDLSNYTAMANRLDPEEIREITGRIFSEIANIVAGYKGFIEKFVGDAILAIFGLPKVHEDDPVRAVRAALDIHAFVRSTSPEFRHRINHPLRMHSGIHTGLIVTGWMNLEKGVHGTVGDTLNVASRLAGTAEPDEIRISAQTHNLVSSYFDTKPLEAVNLKGIAIPVRPFSITNESGVRTRFEAAKRKGFIEFIGRHSEMNQLKACLEKVVAGRGQFVTINGEAGVGKSRLIHEFRNSLDRKKITFLQGRCQSYGENTPYLPFINAFKRGLSLTENDTLASKEQKVIRNILTIDRSLETYLPVYLHLLSIPSDTYPLPKGYFGQKLRTVINEAMAAAILSNAKRQPMVMVLEDWHWADAASRSTLATLRSQMKPYALMAIVLYRPESAVEWSKENRHTSINLRELDKGNTEEVIRSIWKVHALPEELLSLIHERTGGNPYFIEEICKTFVEEGTVKIADQRLVFTKPLEKLVLPATVEAVIQSRLDRLDGQTKKTIQLAAVIGREFSLRILERIVTKKDQLSRAINILLSQELIQKSRNIRETEYVFKHVLTQVAVYGSLLSKQKKAFHAAVGKTLLALHEDRIEEQCEKLAHHFANSDDLEKALSYQEMAGDKAKSVHSLSEARQYYEGFLSVLEATQTPTARRQKYIDVSVKWAEVSQYTPSDKVRNTLMQALTYAFDLDEWSQVAEVNYWIGKISYMQGDFVEVIPRVEESIKWAKKASDTNCWASLRIFWDAQASTHASMHRGSPTWKRGLPISNVINDGMTLSIPPQASVFSSV